MEESDADTTEEESRSETVNLSKKRMFQGWDATKISLLDHGTNSASIIGSIPNNSKGISGACLGRCFVMCLRAVDDDLQTISTREGKQAIELDSDDNLRKANDAPNVFSQMQKNESEKRVIRALRYAYHMGARISSNSYGRMGKPSFELQDELLRLSALDDRGLLFVTAAGNKREDLDDRFELMQLTVPDQKATVFQDHQKAFFPAAASSVPGVIVVGSSDKDGQRLPFSNYGRNSVSLFAPGILIAAGTSGEFNRNLEQIISTAPA